MDFGRNPQVPLETVDFSLPQGDDSVLSGIPDPDFKFYLGASKWGDTEWCGTLYPERLNSRDFLTEYAKVFNYVELNACFYQIPEPERLRSWKEKVAENPLFKFTPKVSRSISHIKRFKNASAETEMFLNACRELGDSLGPIFFQMPDNFGSKNYELLENYLLTLPEDLTFNVELRNPTWFEPAVLKQTMEMFKDLDIGVTMTDTNTRRDVLHMYLTTRSVHIRFNGNDRHPTDFYRLEAWRDRIVNWMEKGIKEVYFALHQENQKLFISTVMDAERVFKELIQPNPLAYLRFKGNPKPPRLFE